MPKAVLLGLAIVLVVAGGCGERGGGGREGESFRADADAACTERQRALIKAYDTAQQDGKSGAALDEATVRAQVDGESGPCASYERSIRPRASSTRTRSS